MDDTPLSRLAANIERQTRADGAHPTVVPDLTLFRGSAPSEPTAVVYEASLCIVAQGCKQVLLSGEWYQYDPAHFLLVSVDLPVTGRVVAASDTAPYLGLRMTFDPRIIAELVAEGVAADAHASTRGLAVSPLEPPLLDAVARLVALLDAPADANILAPLVLREITYRVLAGSQGARLRQIAAAGAPGQRIARAIRFLKEHFSEPLRVEDLARAVRLSPSSFHQHFKRVTTMSPLQYQKRLRLQEARRLMLGAGLEAAEAAFRVGYESASQFSREYRREFGAPPRRDVEAIRGAPEAAPAPVA